MTLLFGSGITPPTEPRDPESKSRTWYQALFQYMTPTKVMLTPERAYEIIDQNWDMTWKDIRTNGIHVEEN